MKAVVTEVRGKRAVVLSGDGLFKNIKNNGYSIGQRIELKWWDWKLLSFNGRLAHLAAAFILTLGLSASGTAYAFFTPASYISMDINPSVQLNANYFNRVISVHPVNKDAEELIWGMEIKYLKVDRAVVDIVKKASLAGYLDNPATNAVLITAANKNPEKLKQVSQNILKGTDEIVEPSGATVTIEVDKINPVQIQKARDYHTTPGKVRIVEKYIDSLPSEKAGKINESEWVQKPVKEIMKGIKENKKKSKNSSDVQIDEAKNDRNVHKKPEQKSNKNNRLTPEVKIERNDEKQRSKEKDREHRDEHDKKK